MAGTTALADTEAMSRSVDTLPFPTGQPPGYDWPPDEPSSVVEMRSTPRPTVHDEQTVLAGNTDGGPAVQRG